MNVTTEQELRAAIAAAEPLIFIENDIDVRAGFVVNYALGIQSDGKALRWTGTNYQAMLRVSANGSLTLTGVVLDGRGMSMILVQIWGGSCTLAEGTVLRNVLCSGSGGAVFVGSLSDRALGGSCVMKGALITATDKADAVLVCDGEMSMYAGARIAHTTSRGMGLINATLNMRGDAAIEHNSYTHDAVAGVIATEGSVVNMGLDEGDAPVIAYNEALAAYVGGAYLLNDSVLNMRYAAAIRDNRTTAYVGGVALSNAALNMEDDAAITGNVAQVAAGGVYALSGSRIRLAGRARIAANRADGAPGHGGGAYLSGEGTRMMLAGSASITANAAVGRGGGVYVTEGAALELADSARIG